MTKGRPVITFPEIPEQQHKDWLMKVIGINDDYEETHAYSNEYLATLDLNSLKLIFKQQSNTIKHTTLI